MASIKRGIILMNLGSPESTKTRDVKKYLDEFLMDERVIDMPYISRYLLVRGIITPFRAPKSAEAYKTIWTSEGSPLIVISKNQQKALQEIVAEPVEIAMRYGKPTPETAFNNLLQIQPGLEEVIAVPMYPHYAMSSFETAVVHVRDTYNKFKFPFKLTFVEPYYNHQSYISALASSMQPFVSMPYDHLLFSYHGIPARHLKKTDPGCHCLQTENCCQVSSPSHATCYRHQVLETTRLVCEKLNIPASKYSISFQSRLGKGWLEPFTDKRLEELPSEGIKNLLVICPAFVSDCLETLEEIAERGKESFIEAGGKNYTMIPCLNEHPEWIETLKTLVNEAGADT